MRLCPKAITKQITLTTFYLYLGESASDNGMVLFAQYNKSRNDNFKNKNFPVCIFLFAQCNISLLII